MLLPSREWAVAVHGDAQRGLRERTAIPMSAFHFIYRRGMLRKFEKLTDQQLSDAIAEKTATAETERAAASLLRVPAHLVMAKRIEEQIAELKA